MPESLPEVTQEFTANVQPYVDRIQEMINRTKDLMTTVVELQATINSLEGKTINIVINEMTKNISDHVNVVQDVVDVTTKHTSALSGSTEGLSSQSAAATELTGVFARLAQENKDVISGIAAEASALRAATTATDEATRATYEQTLATHQAIMAQLELAAAQARVANFNEGAFRNAMMSTEEIFTQQLKTDAALIASYDAVRNSSEGLAFSEKALGGEWARVTNIILEQDAATRAAGSLLATMVAPIRAWGTAMNEEFQRFGFRIGGVRVGLAALHWVVTGTMEALAVLVPAAVALGAGLAVAAQGAQNLGQHLNAVWTATEATSKVFHTTAGDVLGLGHSLQTAQDAANPGVYTILGAAINIMKAHFQGLAGVGLQVVHMFDEFAARVTVDMQGALGGQIQGLLSRAAADLQELGQIAANLGHAFLNVASAMPGLAAILLNIAKAVSEVILWISKVPAGFIMAAIALEEFYRWGGVVAALLVRLVGLGGAFRAALKGVELDTGVAAGFITKFGLALKILAGGVATAIEWLGKLAIALGMAGLGNAVTGFAARMRIAVEALTPLKVAGMAGVVAGIAILIYALSRVHNATQNWIDATNQAVKSASDLTVLGVVGTKLAQLGPMLSQQTVNWQHYSGAQKLAGSALSGWVGDLQKIPGPLADATQGLFNMSGRVTGLSDKTGLLGKVTHTLISNIPGLSSVLGVMGSGAEQASFNVDALTKEQQKLITTAHNVFNNVQMLGGVFHTSAVQTMVLANAAGVNLANGMAKGSEAARIAVQQIKNYLTGIGAMGAPIGVLGNDISALGISSGLASSKVSQLNQAWDQFISLGSGLQSTFVTLQQGLQAMSSSSATSIVHIGTLRAELQNLNLTAGTSMNGLNASSLALRSAFQGSIGNAQQFFDALRTGAAAGAVSAKNLTTVIASVVLEMLPFAQHSKTAVAQLSALAQEAGGPATNNFRTLRTWLEDNGVSGRRLNGILGTMTQQLSNVTKVAQQFSQALQQDWIAAVAAGATPTKVLTADTQALKQAISQYSGASPQAAAAAKKLDEQLFAQGATTKEVRQLNKQLGLTSVVTAGQFAIEQTAAGILTGQFDGLNAIIQGSHGNRQALLDDMARMITKTPVAAGDIRNMATEIALHGTTIAAHSSERKQLIQDLEASGMKSKNATGLVNGLITMLGKIPHQELLDIIAKASGTGQISITSTSKFIGAHGVGGPGVPVSGAAGGKVSGPGTGTSDNVPAMLSHGEYVVRAASVAKYGTHMMDAINQQNFAIGGLVRRFAVGGQASVPASGPTPGIPTAFTGQWESDWAKQWRTQFTNTMISDVRSQMQSAVSQARTMAQAAAAALAAAFAGQGGGNAANAALGQRMAAAFGWTGAQWSALNQIAMMESGWSSTITNPTSTAAGIAQNIAGFGPGYQSGNAAQQIAWMLNYIRTRYGNPENALSFHLSHGWYDKGGMLPTGLSLALNTTGQAERVVPAGGGSQHCEHNIYLMVDGKQIWSSMQQETLKYNVRNGTARQGSMAPSSPASTAPRPLS